MDNLDDSENNAKISDSAYSNSCSNSQSRRSGSSKSTHSGSNSSGSSGYGGKQSTSGSSNNVNTPVKRTKDKDGKKKSVLTETQTEAEFRLPQPAQPPEAKKEKQDDVDALALHTQAEDGDQNMETQSTNICEDSVICHTAQYEVQDTGTIASQNLPPGQDGFSCVISKQDGIVTHTSSLMNTIGFPDDMWIGRSFIDFIHPLDHSTFASQITKGPINSQSETMTDSAPTNEVVSTMFCRIRKYKGLSGGFGVKNRPVTFLPFTLKLTYKRSEDDNGNRYHLIIEATPLTSAFKSAHEIIATAVSFAMRHVSSGNLDHLDPEAVPFLGYFPQDVTGLDVLRLYHPDDLMYMRKIYETIMKDGGAPRSKPYRLMAQNGDYLKLETEWSSFVNPWSHKLEFVVAKHHVLEGPGNPDVFQAPVVPSVRDRRSVAEERAKQAQCLRDYIVRIMNEALTKPAEFAKQQMSKRCKEIASYMNTLIQETPTAEQPERILEAPRKPNSCEHDSELLGGISPHHEYYSDSRTSSETPLSYNQLNFNDNLKRFFDNHQELSNEEYHQAIAGHLEEMKDYKPFAGGCLSPMALFSNDSADVTSSGESSSGPYAFRRQRETSSIRLTESLLSRHNTDMEKSLVKKHRIYRSASKDEREKASNDTKQKKKEHLARCNASFVPASANAEVLETKHGLKRSKQREGQSNSRKHHCSGHRPRRRHAGSSDSTPDPSVTTSPLHRPLKKNIYNPTTYPAPPSTFTPASHVTAGLASYRPPGRTDMVPFVPNIGFPPQTQLINPLTSRQGLVPFLYVPTTAHALPTTSTVSAEQQYHAPPVPYVMYGPAVIGSPIMVSQISLPPFSVEEGMSQYATPQTATTTRITACNREEPIETVFQAPPDIRLQNVTEARNESGNETTNSDDPVDPTDGESSSSFYSSFFRTDPGSADESMASKDNNDDPIVSKRRSKVHPKVVKRKIEPPWMEEVCLTPELMFKYQIPTSDLDDVLAADRKKLAHLEQPKVVNEQLAQLYVDLQLEGVAARLTLEEGLTSSSSSGEDSTEPPAEGQKRMKKKRQYTKLVMIYEEDAPMPPPQTDEAMPSTSLS